MIANLGELLEEVMTRTGMTNAMSRGLRYVSMAEEFLTEELKLGEQERKATARTDDRGWADLPSDYRSMRQVFIQGYELLPRTLAQIESNDGHGRGYLRQDQYYGDGSYNNWHGYVITGGRLRSSEGGVDHDLSYYARVPPLASSENGSNWLLEKKPEAYLYATMVQAHLGMGDYEKAAAAEAYLQKILRGVRSLDRASRFGGMNIAPVNAVP